jgi:hypothetical protein
MTNEQRVASDRYYRNKEKDAALYAELNKMIQRFISPDKLREVAHGMDTNVNKSINNTISYFAPKNRVYCGTRSLQNRVSIAIGVLSLGMVEYFKRLFKALGIYMTPNILHFLEVKEKHRLYRIEKAKTSKAKKDRNKRKFDRLKELESQAKTAFQKREGTYKTGGNVYGFDNNEDDGNKKKKTNRSYANSIFPFVARKDMLRKRASGDKLRSIQAAEHV